MSGDFWLDWLTLTVSLYNTILLLWLALAVLLNAERRHLGIWLAGGGLLTGAAFFLSHTVILGSGFWGNPAINFWWQAGWIPVILSPLTWYVVMLWYAGFWEGRQNPIYRRHALPLALLVLTALAFTALFIFAHPLPTFRQIANYNLEASPSISGVPALILLYPPFIIACIGLSLEALLRPGPTVRMMGSLARRRARPWLAAAGSVLLLVSLLVTGILLYATLFNADRVAAAVQAQDVAIVDLIISALIAAAVTLTGQAIVAYEVFTGKSLPRGGLQRYWRWTLLLAVGIGALTGFYLARNLPALYGLLAGVCGLAAGLALLSRQSYEERKRFITDLRPFVAGPQSYTALLAPAVNSSGEDIQAPFRSLCGQLLGASWAVLTPQSAVAELFGPPLVYPPGGSPPNLDFDAAQFTPETLCLPLDPSPETPPAWAVPLWNPLGLCGVLLLGEKSGGGVYTQEEIEVARAACERLVDAQAGAEAARRLLTLQRRQLAESQVLDRRARRVLHDDVLPQLHAALLAVNAAGDEAERGEAVALLAGAHRQIADLLHDIPKVTTPQTITLGLATALRQVAEEELRGAFERVEWRIDPAVEALARSLPAFTAETIFYAAREVMRNAARHAQPPEASGLRLEVALTWTEGIEIRIADNGMGGENGIAEAGASTTLKQSAGLGLALHRTLLALVGGTLELERTAAGSACVRLWAPIGLEPGRPPAQNEPLE